MLESLDVRSVRPYGDRPYEWVLGEATFAVEPGAAGNARITDLDLAPCDPDGRVRFTADVSMLRPVRGGNGRALVVAPNRGMIHGVPFGGGGPVMPSRATAAPAAGDGFLLDRGWTVVWCGWQCDVRRDRGWSGLTAPVAAAGPGRMRLEFRPDTPVAEHALSDSGPMVQFADYPTADLADPEAFLTVRTAPFGPRRTIARDRWRFTAPGRFAVDGGFRPFHFYELVYRCAYAPVVGTGLLALRDLGAHLKAGHDHVFAAGVSQCGRLLRTLLHEGLNVDDDGRGVYDGVFAEIAGARRGEFNQRYGQPALLGPMTPGYGPPHDTTALLRRQRALGGVPKIMLTNSAYEYWRGDGALVHQDGHTGADLPEDPDARVHLLSGTDHIGPAPGFKDQMPVVNPVSALDPAPVLRALFVQLEEWVCDGRQPAPSQVPRRADGTATTRDEVLAAFPGAGRPDPAQLPYTPEIDPAATTWPLTLGPPLVALVSAVDERGNEVAGIRLPAVRAGVAAYTGWNPRRPVDGLPDLPYEMIGSRLRGRSADRAAVRAAAQALVSDRFLRPEDLERAVAQAMADR